MPSSGGHKTYTRVRAVSALLAELEVPAFLDRRPAEGLPALMARELAFCNDFADFINFAGVSVRIAARDGR